jgi:hypothetical protein
MPPTGELFAAIRRMTPHHAASRRIVPLTAPWTVADARSRRFGEMFESDVLERLQLADKEVRT